MARQVNTRSYSGPPISVTTFQYDNSRTGWNSQETDLTPASIAASGAFGIIAQLQVDGQVLGQPLFYAGYTMADGSVHDVLVVATMHNTVYAFDANTYVPLWSINLGVSQINTRLNFNYTCNNVGPEYGIGGTPVIAEDPATGKMMIYLVAGTESPPGTFAWTVHAVDLGSGVDRASTPITASVKLVGRAAAIKFDPLDQWSRPAVAYNNGYLYFGVGSHCDKDAHDIGWMFRYDQSLIQQSALPMVNVLPSGVNPALYSSIWMSGYGAAIDAGGNVFVATGNGSFVPPAAGQGGDWGQSVLRLKPDLSGVADSFTPSVVSMLNGLDLDLGSGGVMLLPSVAGQTAPPMTVAFGKNPTMYLLNQTNLGGFTASDTGALQVVNLNTLTGLTAGVRGGPAYYDGPPFPDGTHARVYYQANKDYLRVFGVSTGAQPSLTLEASATTGLAGGGGSIPVVSSNGAGAAAADTGLVWVVHRTRPPQLEAYDAMSLAQVYAGAFGYWPPQYSELLTSPLVANGRVYVGSIGRLSATGAPIACATATTCGLVTVFGLKGP